jgi:hypothetical protein
MINMRLRAQVTHSGKEIGYCRHPYVDYTGKKWARDGRKRVDNLTAGIYHREQPGIRVGNNGLKCLPASHPAVALRPVPLQAGLRDSLFSWCEEGGREREGRHENEYHHSHDQRGQSFNLDREADVEREGQDEVKRTSFFTRNRNCQLRKDGQRSWRPDRLDVAHTRRAEMYERVQDQTPADPTQHMSRTTGCDAGRSNPDSARDSSCQAQTDGETSARPAHLLQENCAPDSDSELVLLVPCGMLETSLSVE